MREKDKVVKISSELYFQIRELAHLEGREIKFLINKAVINYLKSRKVLKE